MANADAVGSPYTGSRIRLIGTSNIRYEGTLFKSDTNESTTALPHVRSFGTEGRRREGTEVPPRDEAYKYRIFKGSDVADPATLSFTASTAVEDPAVIPASGTMSRAETPLMLDDVLPSRRQRAASQFRESSRRIYAKLQRDGFIVLDLPVKFQVRLSRAHQSLRSYRCKATFEGAFVSARHLLRRHVLEFNAGGSARVLDQDLPPVGDDWSHAFQKQAYEATHTLKVATTSVLDAICFSTGIGINAARHHLLEDEVAGADGTVSSSILQVVSYEPAPTPAEASKIATYGEHVDEGLLTAVYCPTPGLQVHVPTRPSQPGQWIDVSSGHGTIVFMVGHTLEHATAGALRACIHRVQPTTSLTWRTSLAFKLKARSTAILPRGLMQAEEKDNSVSALMQRFRQTYGPSLNGAARVSAPDESLGGAARVSAQDGDQHFQYRRLGEKREALNGAARVSAQDGEQHFQYRRFDEKREALNGAAGVSAQDGEQHFQYRRFDEKREALNGAAGVSAQDGEQHFQYRRFSEKREALNGAAGVPAQDGEEHFQYRRFSEKREAPNGAAGVSAQDGEQHFQYRRFSEKREALNGAARVSAQDGEQHFQYCTLGEKREALNDAAGVSAQHGEQHSRYRTLGEKRDRNTGAARVSAGDGERHVQRRRLGEKQDRYTLFVNTLTGKTFAVECETLMSSVGELMRRLQPLEGIPLEDMRLISDGGVLRNDNATLFECGVFHECTIFLTRGVSGD